MKPHCLLLALTLLATGCAHDGLPPGASPLPPHASTSPMTRESAQAPPSLQPSAAAADWQTFTAKDGAFSVEAPQGFAEDETSLQVHRFGTRPSPTSAGYEVGIIEIQAADRKVPRGVLVHSLVEGLVKKSPKVLKREQARLHHVYPVERAVFKTDDGRTVLAQVFATEKYLWAMQISIPANMRDARDVNISRFMDSITVKDKPAFEAADKLPPEALPDKPTGAPAASGAPPH